MSWLVFDLQTLPRRSYVDWRGLVAREGVGAIALVYAEAVATGDKRLAKLASRAGMRAHLRARRAS